MSWINELEDKFTRLHILEKGQFKVYYHLLTSIDDKGLKAKDIADEIPLNRTYVYNVLAFLTKQGLVSALRTKPQRYLAVDPSYYLKKMIEEKKDELDQFRDLLSYVTKVVTPELDKRKGLHTRPLKEAFFIESLGALIDNIQERLKTVRERIYIRAPDFVIEIVYSILVKKAAAIIDPSESKKNVVVIYSIIKKVEFDIPKALKGFFVPTNTSIETINIVLDDSTYVFNLNPDNPESFLGMGTLIESVDIANNYAHKMRHAFEEALFKSLSPSTEEDLLPPMREDPSFVQTMNTLFNQNWRIVPFFSNPKSNYIVFFAPKGEIMVHLREVMVLYQPLGDNSTSELAEEIYKITKQEASREIAIEETLGLSATFDEEEAELYGFQCKIFHIRYKFTNPSPYLLGHNVLTQKSGKMVVFEYKKRAVIMIGGAIAEYVDHVLDLLSNY